MYHVFDIMASMNNLLECYYFDKPRNPFPKTPQFFSNIYTKYVNNEINGGAISDREQLNLCEINKNSVYRSSTAPLYTAVGNNLKEAIVERIPIYTRNKNEEYFMNAVTVIIPSDLFSDTIEFEETAFMLIDLYFKILSLDDNMMYKPSVKTLYLYDSKINIPVYDITMVMCALGFVCANLKSWFDTSGDDIEIPLETSEVIDSFKNYLLVKEMKIQATQEFEYKWNKLADKINRIFNKHCKAQNEIRDALINNKIITGLYQD